MKILEEAKIADIKLRNRLIRSATFEGMSDKDGYPKVEMVKMVSELAAGGIGAIITGFMFVSQKGRCMQPGQCGIESKSKIESLNRVVNAAHNGGAKIFAQLAHTGRQSSSIITGNKLLSSSDIPSKYFRESPFSASIDEIELIIEEFADSALIAKMAGFDGIQLHAAHGYLIHQFLIPAINKRKDIFGVDRNSGLGTKLLERIIDSVRKKCGREFPILVKISGWDDLSGKFNELRFKNLIAFLDYQSVDAIEISYGTMDFALNIIRGEKVPVYAILKYNPFYKIKNTFLRKLWKSVVYPYLKRSVIPFSQEYNKVYSEIAKKITKVPIISVGGHRDGKLIEKFLTDGRADFISLSRPLLAEPDFPNLIKAKPDYKSKCINCNLCTVMCDSEFETRCYNFKRRD